MHIPNPGVSAEVVGYQDEMAQRYIANALPGAGARKERDTSEAVEGGESGEIRMADYRSLSLGRSLIPQETERPENHGERPDDWPEEVFCQGDEPWDDECKD